MPADSASVPADARWHGWTWTPDAAELQAFVGRYEREGALLPTAVVELALGTLHLTSSERRYRLTPGAAPDLFGAQTFAFDAVDAVAFVRGPGGEVVGLDWAGQRYERR